MTEPRVDWGLTVAARLTLVGSVSQPRMRPVPRGMPPRPSDVQIVYAMSRGEFASGAAGRRVLMLIFSRLAGVTIIAIFATLVVGVTGQHTGEFVLRVIKAVCLAVMVFTGSLALFMERRSRQMAVSGAYPRRRSTLLLPLILGALAGVFAYAVQPIR